MKTRVILEAKRRFRRIECNVIGEIKNVWYQVIEICLIYDSRVILEEMWRDLLQRMNFP